ncbi:Dak phosphatase [Rhodospirillum rubrum F11]|uniref:Dak phosphatase n=1 Tax=Rhodospirillum rubrum (strain ATCC 11170 / ATH 1.1.1 / DSM 467 / LMG 4362 / NCIMB 8255 / S1) TaxID=269796 RepID=Q2RUQ3_RHORT|nr:dihydroxyacetone kinase subunit DhaL [Rhodospirillum rubrum]ABC22142.1 Dak phosphatase [Rhodospirillum rubrum ATCC 11170]AEO47857.1 Dak phosphatase [Rhodospirillum rubrum F11]MBK5953731.1 dihydroxyacetone kinase subunit L [Rhodospirillum rubrum]QXG81791.1 dihydroxyacetone kinase subunit L [Rhodospirillum rubrum]
MTGIPLAAAGGLVVELIETINANRAHLSEIDGAIGDGDHGINMSKGFTQAGAALGDPPPPLPDALRVLSDTLFEGIGGSMGPLYGSLFSAMADTLDGAEILDGPLYGRMIRAGLDGVEEIGSAKPGDKTLLDSLAPAVDAFDAAQAEGRSFAESLDAMTLAAERGRDATRDMIAKVGRAARLGERSRGALDAGASSCCLILGTLACGVKKRLA